MLLLTCITSAKSYTIPSLAHLYVLHKYKVIHYSCISFTRHETENPCLPHTIFLHLVTKRIGRASPRRRQLWGWARTAPVAQPAMPERWHAFRNDNCQRAAPLCLAPEPSSIGRSSTWDSCIGTRNIEPSRCTHDMVPWFGSNCKPWCAHPNYQRRRAAWWRTSSGNW